MMTLCGSDMLLIVIDHEPLLRRSYEVRVLPARLQAGAVSAYPGVTASGPGLLPDRARSGHANLRM